MYSGILGLAYGGTYSVESPNHINDDNGERIVPELFAAGVIDNSMFTFIYEESGTSVDFGSAPAVTTDKMVLPIDTSYIPWVSTEPCSLLEINGIYYDPFPY